MVEGGPAVVEYLGDGRKQEALDGFWETKTQEQRQGVEAISMDLWEAYRNSTIQYLPGALEKIVYDPFHLMKHLNQAVDTVRKQEHRILMKQGDGRLSGSKYSWLKGMENLSSTQVQTFNELKSQKLQTSRAWAIKEMFRDFWNCSTGQEAKEYFTQWYDWAIRSRMDPIKKVAKMFKRHLNNILTYFRFHLSNAALEGLNSRISNIIKKACGYRNRERFKADILFHLGGLDLFPGQEKITT
jgi:transposase